MLNTVCWISMQSESEDGCAIIYADYICWLLIADYIYWLLSQWKEKVLSGNHLKCEPEDGCVLNLLEVEEESNLPLEGSARARLGKEKPQKVLDPINCLPIHLIFLKFFIFIIVFYFLFWSHQLSPQTPAFYYLRGGGFCNCSKCIWHQKLLETVKWIPLREKNKNICNINCPDALRSKVSSEQNNFFHAFYLQTKLEWIWLKKMNSGSSGSSGSSMSIVNVYVFENSALTKMTSTFVLPVLITNVNSVYVSMVWQVGWWQSPPALVAGPQGRLPAKVSQSYPASLVSRALAGLLKVEAMKRL